MKIKHCELKRIKERKTDKVERNERDQGNSREI